jgi:hypothetical protein
MEDEKNTSASERAREAEARLARASFLTNRALRWAFAASLFGLSVSFIASMIGRPMVSPALPSVGGKLAELDKIRTSLATLDTYVAAQQEGLKSLENTLDALRHEKADLEKAVSLDRAKVDALLRFEIETQQKTGLFRYGMSYLLGVFSSLTATFLVALVRRRRALRAMDNRPK